MVQEFTLPKSESDIRYIQDKLYLETKRKIEQGETPSWKGLKEIASSEPNIITAIHKIKANKGSMTAGVDNITIRDFLGLPYEEVIKMVQSSFKDYRPHLIRRKYIPKPGKKTEKRPLGIPVIIDRIIQECIRAVIEPILEAQFFKHSYGFRPMRDTHMALERTTSIAHHTGYHWIVEGDISKCFDTINHSKLIKQLWHLGIRDRRVLMMIKAMLKAGILGEMKSNPIGTPQGGIISPLLANAYLHKLDQWIVREWEEKQTRHQYTGGNRTTALRKTNLKPAYLVRYADDWVLVTNTKANADKWKKRIAKYLETNLKLKLSEEKTLITNLEKRPIKFLGFSYKVTRSNNAKKGWIPRTKPDDNRLDMKIKELNSKIHHIRKVTDKEKLIHEINVVNSTIRGIIQYYEATTWVNISLTKYSRRIGRKAYKALKYSTSGEVKPIPAKQCSNLPTIHQNYETKIPAIKLNNIWIGITSLAFSKWKKVIQKNQNETPYSLEGRELYRKRTDKTQPLARQDLTLSLHLSELIANGLSTNPMYNFEYFMNRAYAFNRDKGKCRVCGEYVEQFNLHIHHTHPYLPSEMVNRVQYLATVHKDCHVLIHAESELPSYLPKKMKEKILKFRDMLKPVS